MTQALSIQSHATDASINERHYPFRFNVQSWIRRDEASSRHNRVLASRGNYASIPPSLKHEISPTPQGAQKPRAGARVTYKLTARLLKDHHTVGTLVQPILLYLSRPPSPPMCVTDFTGEYRPVSKSVLRGPLFRKTGEISAIVQEPKQLTVRADRADSMVELPIKMMLERFGGDAALSNFPSFEAEISWDLRCSTFVSIFEQQGPPTLKEALVSPATAFVRSSLGSRSLRMVWRNWRRIGGDPSRIESEQSLWVTLPRSKVLTPTFWSPFLSRRYSIRLQLKVTKPGTAKLEVEVPIQVGIDDALVDGGDGCSRVDPFGNAGSIFDDADGDELLPQYQR